MTTKIRPPRHLSDESRAWFTVVSKDFDLESHHFKLLQQRAKVGTDRSKREILLRDGLTFVDRHGHIRPNPAVNIERDSRGLFARLVRELGLDVVEPDSQRPPAIQGTGQRVR